ncbi:MAG TPA: outer membrane protein transport protein, partial [Cellvibrio sp.]|nr:outer membrane protein transport protein [Cellvibrio sp.]
MLTHTRPATFRRYLTSKSLHFYSIPLLTSIALFPSFTSAASFQILEQSPAHLGKSFAGTASDVIDASSVFFNPASTVELEQPILTLGANAIVTNSKFSNENSNTRGINGETDEVGYVPNAYYVHPASEKLSFGIGINAPYGLASEYEDNWYGRYLATYSQLEIININAISAYRLTDTFSFGVGINYQMADVTLESQFDSTLGVNPAPATDSSAKIQGDDDSFAADLSFFYQPNERTNLGLIWRQGGEFDL